MNKKITLTRDGTQVRKSRGYSKLYNVTGSLILLLFIFAIGCKKDDFKGEVTGLCPVVVSTDPMDKAVDVVLNKVISATFNTSMKASTVNSASFTIKQGSALVAGKVGPATNGATFTFTPDVALLPFTTYTGTISAAATDTLRTAMVADYVWTFTTIPQVTVSSNPAAGGTASGGGDFAQGSVVTVNAVANPGFVFTDWRNNGTTVSTSSSYQFTMSGNRALVANFAPVVAGNFAVNLSSSPAAGGTTNGAGSFSAGSTVTVTTSPNTGYAFVNWTDNGNIVSTSSSYQFSLNANRTLVANYRIIPGSQFAVILSSSPAGGGTTNGSGAFNAGTSVTVTAAANTGYTFVNWTDNGNVASTSSSYTFALNSNRSLVANFAINTYTLNVVAVNGTVNKNPNQATYNHGSTVDLTATPASGFTFTSWSGDASGTVNPLTVTMNSNKNITANFSPVAAGNSTINLSSNPAAGGTTSGGGSFATGSTRTVTASVNPGYSFINWTENGNLASTNASYQFVLIGNRALVANFSQTPSVGPAEINFGAAADFVILSEAGITNISASSITGNIGASPISGAALTGISCPEVIGSIYTIDAAGPACRIIDPVLLSTAVSNMETAYTTANGLTTPAPVIAQSAGNLNGQTLAPGIYKWATGVSITTGITLAGGPNDTWVFQIAQDLTVNNSAIITLSGGAQAKNITWVVAGQAVLGTNVDFSGSILSKNLISLNTGAKVTGRLLAQKAVTLIKNIVVKP